MSFSAGDVNLHTFHLSGVDLRMKVSDFDVYENLMKPYSSVTATMIDNADLLNQVFSNKNITLDLSFSQPGQPPYVGKFTITAVEKSKTSGSLRVATYTISGYSRHMTRFPRVQRAYREMPATSVIQDLVQSYLSPDKPLVIRAPSKGIVGNDHMPFNVNGVQVHKAIRGLLERAVSSVDPSSAYVFFEDNRNLVIDTLENMRNNVSSQFTFIQRPMGQNFLRDAALQNLVILAMREEARMDSSSDPMADNQQVNPFDVFSHDDTGRTVGQKGLVATIMNIAAHAMRPPTNLSQVLPERKKIANDFDSQSLTIQVPLNTLLTVGQGFAVDLVAPLGDTDRKVQDGISGDLVATEIRHRVDLGLARMQGTTTCKGVKGGL